MMYDVLCIAIQEKKKKGSYDFVSLICHCIAATMDGKWMDYEL